MAQLCMSVLTTGVPYKGQQQPHFHGRQTGRCSGGGEELMEAKGKGIDSESA